jgi:TonB family protein
MTGTTLSNLNAWSLQVGILAFAAAVVSRFAHIDAPVVRYAWWRTVLVVCLALPVIQPWQPPALVTGGTLAIEGASPAPVVESARAGTPSVPPPAISRPTPSRWPTIVAAVLVAGALLRLAWLGAGLRRLRRRPVVLLPESLGMMSVGVQQAVLAHELWHVRRRDWLWNLGEEMPRAVLWSHPAIWYLTSRVQAAREEVVDELAVLSTNARRSYLDALLAFAGEPAAYPAAPFIRRRQLFTRMLLISREAVMSSRRIVASSAAMAGVLVLTGWYGALAFPLTATGAGDPAAERGRQAQAQPRDPRTTAPRPVTSREQVLRTATADDPSNVQNWIELARLQEERGAIAEAEATFQSAIAVTGGNRQVLSSMAGFFTRIGQFDKAVRALEDAAAQNPSDPTGHQLVATHYWEKAQRDASLSPLDKLFYIDAGIAATDRALAQRPDYVEALTYKNILLRLKGNLETDAVRRQQLFAEADILRGRAMELARQRTGASSAASDPSAPPPPPQNYEVDGQQAVRIGGSVATPAKLRDVRPVYPQDAQDARVSGVVIIEALIDTQGAVRSTRVLRSIPLLDQAALDAVEHWKFTPTLLNGVPVPVVMTVTVNFTLQ